VCVWQLLFIVSESDFKYSNKNMSSILCPFPFYNTGYHDNLIIRSHLNILFTIKAEGSSRETAKQEQKEKLHSAFRSSVSKALQYIGIRGISVQGNMRD
jgi:hypothetical protein